MSLRILVVEDDPISSDVLASLLLVRGHTVDIAADGFHAARLARDIRYDVIFIDYHLPEMDGYLLARLLRTPDGDGRSDFTMIALTADHSGLAARRGADTLFDHILAKPIEPDELFALIAHLCVARPAPQLLDPLLSEKARSASATLWRARGLAEAPAAAVLPNPSAAEAARLSCCFRLVAPAEADCFLLIGPAAPASLEAARQTARAHLLPVFVVDSTLAGDRETAFAIGDRESWSNVARTLAAYAQRRAKLSAEWLDTPAMDDRLLAFLYVAGRGLKLRRDPRGTTSVVDGGGFAPSLVIEAVRRLAAKGLLVTSPPKSLPSGTREMELVPSALAVQKLTRSGSASSAMH